MGVLIMIALAVLVASVIAEADESSAKWAQGKARDRERASRGRARRWEAADARKARRAREWRAESERRRRLERARRVREHNARVPQARRARGSTDRERTYWHLF